MENVGCDSGIIGDMSVAACLSGACSFALKQASCQMCMCKACRFCEGFGVEMLALPPPAPPLRCRQSSPDDANFASCSASCSPGGAEAQCKTCRCQACSFCTDTPQACRSVHIGDSSIERCDDFCTRSEFPNDLICSFCFCRGCQQCGRPTEALSSISHIDTSVCPIGAELLIISSKQYRKGTEYAAKLRIASWQANARIEIDFSNAHSSVEVDPESIKHARFKGDGEASLTVELAAYGDDLGGFSFKFLLPQERFNLQQGPIITCTNVKPVPAPMPHPPPPPHQPWLGIRPPPPPQGFMRSPLQQCSIGGTFHLGSVWAGGSSYRASVVIAVWKPGAEVSRRLLLPAEKLAVLSEVNKMYLVRMSGDS